MDYSELYSLAAKQRAFVRLADARLLGASAKTIRGWIARNEWERAGPRLLHRTGAPIDNGARVMRDLLDVGVGAVLGSKPAAAWWGLPGYDLLQSHILRPRHISGSASSFGAKVHEGLDITPDQITVLDGIPIVRPDRLAFDLFASEHPARAARAVETAWAKRLLSGASLRSTFDELAERGRKGTVAMREFLDTHPVDWVPPATNLEARFGSIMDGAALGQWQRQVNVGETHWVGRVDFLHDRLPVIVEVQSERYHTALLDQAADAERKADLEAAGFIVVEVWDTWVWHDRQRVVASVRAALHAARRPAA
jgi:very-short-patch-repair endonuclease